MMMQHSGYNLSDLVQEAQHRWLKPPEVLFILKNYEDSQLTDKPLQKPPGGSLFLFNKRVLRYFRKDGHSWRRKKDGRTVGEAHERLKVGNAEALNCYYAHGELNPNFQRRSYWMLEPAYEHIVLVHYRDITEVRHSGGSILQSSPGSYSTLNQSPSSYTTQVPGTTSFAPEFQEQIQILSNPGSVNGSFQSDIKNDMINISDVIERNEEIYSSPKVDINQALKRLTQQLSLEDNCSGDNESFYDDNGVSHDTEYNVHGQSSIFPNQLQDDSDHRIAQLFPGDGKGHYWQPFEDDFSCNEENAILNEFLGSYNNAAPAGSQETHLHIPNENEAFLSPSSKKPVEEEESFEWADLAVNDTFSCPTSVLLPEEAEYFKIATYSPSMNVYGINSDHYSTVFEQVPTERPLEENPSLTVSQKQLFTIHEISPEWGYAHEATKVIVIGSFLCDPSDHVWTCMFGEIEVPVQIIHDGVIRCQAPPSLPGKVTLCLTSSNRESCSEVREFEYRECPSSLPHSKLLEAEASKDSEELLFLVRFVQMLLSDPLISKREISGSGIELLGNVEGNEELWSGVIESLLAGNCTSSGIANWLLQELLKDKLQQWLSSRLQQVNDLQGGSFSKKEQGIIHMVAGMGYEWALKPILNSGVNVNYRDTNGFTALHWAARFGREEMVAALIASGASAEAVTDPTKEAPTGKTPASIAAEYGYLGLAGYLSEVSLTSHLSSLTIAESELSKNSASLEAERTINSISDISTITSEDQQSFRDSLAAVRNTAEAAARIQAAFRAHSFRKRKLKEAAAAAFMANVDSQDQYSLLSNDAQSLSAASKLFFRNTRDYNNAALSIQKKYRGWKSRRDFLAFRQKVVKIQVALSRALNGIGLAIVGPAIQSLVADSTDDNSRGMAFGWLQLTSNLGAIMGGLFSVMLAPTTFLGIPGWRISFHLVGIISVLVGILVRFFANDPHYSNGGSTSTTDISNKTLWSEVKDLAQEAKSVMKIQSFQIIVAQGVTGSFPWSALSFSAMWLELAGFSHKVTAFIVAMFVVGSSLGGLFGGRMGDILSKLLPNSGRIILSQISSASAIPLAAILLLALPNNPSTIFLHTLVFFTTGFFISWNGPATNNPIFAEIVPEKSRTTIYALDRSFETVLSSFAPPIVGMLAQHVYGFEPVPEGSENIATDRENAESLAKALYTAIGIPMGLCCLIYTFLYFTYPRDRERAQMDVLIESELQQIEFDSSSSSEQYPEVRSSKSKEHYSDGMEVSQIVPLDESEEKLLLYRQLTFANFET